MENNSQNNSHQDSASKSFESFADIVFNAMRDFAGTWPEGSKEEDRRTLIEMLARSTSNNLRYAEEAGIALTFGKPIHQFRAKNGVEWFDMPMGEKEFVDAILSRSELYEIRTTYEPVDNKNGTEAVEKKANAGCGKCGCVGIHACPGQPIPPWTPEKIKEFEEILSQYETDAEGEPTQTVHAGGTNLEIAKAVAETNELWYLVRRATPLQQVRRVMREKGISYENMLARLSLARPHYNLESLTQILRGSDPMNIDDLHVLADALQVSMTINVGE